MFILNFAKCTNALVNLTRKGIPFQFGLEQQMAQDDLKQALITSPALCPINYSSDSPVILTVDMSTIAVGFYLCQADAENPQKCYYACFGLIPLNDREWHFSQPKLELYRLFCALRTYKIFIIRVQNLIVEVDARYIKGMLNNPNIAPSASINRWIISILTFHFELRHIPGTQHGPDGLSQHPPQPSDLSDEENLEDFDDWVDNLYRFIHLLNPPVPTSTSAQLLCTFTTEQTHQQPKDTVDADCADPPIQYYQVPRL